MENQGKIIYEFPDSDETIEAPLINFMKMIYDMVKIVEDPSPEKYAQWWLEAISLSVIIQRMKNEQGRGNDNNS